MEIWENESPSEKIPDTHTSLWDRVFLRWDDEAKKESSLQFWWAYPGDPFPFSNVRLPQKNHAQTVVPWLKAHLSTLRAIHTIDDQRQLTGQWELDNPYYRIITLGEDHLRADPSGEVGMRNHRDFLHIAKEVPEKIEEISKKLNDALHEKWGMPEKYRVLLKITSWVRNDGYNGRLSNSSRFSSHRFGIAADIGKDFFLMDTERNNANILVNSENRDYAAEYKRIRYVLKNILKNDPDIFVIDENRPAHYHITVKTPENISPNGPVELARISKKTVKTPKYEINTAPKETKLASVEAPITAITKMIKHIVTQGLETLKAELMPKSTPEVPTPAPTYAENPPPKHASENATKVATVKGGSIHNKYDIPPSSSITPLQKHIKTISMPLSWEGYFRAFQREKLHIKNAPTLRKKTEQHHGVEYYARYAEKHLERSGHTFRELQTILKKEHYYTGNVDGIFGPKTLLAVRRYQSVHLQDTGLSDRWMLGKLTIKTIFQDTNTKA